MKLVLWNPARELDRLENRLHRIFGELATPWDRKAEALEAWEPAVDIFETEKEFVLKAELPEVDPKDVKATVEGNILTLTGERKREKEIKEENYHRTERFYGSFTRTFVLPDTVDREKIKATFKDGVMRLELPKREEVKPKEIEIKAA